MNPRLPGVAWPTTPLQELAQIRTGVAKGGKRVKVPVELPYVRVANVQDGGLKLDEVKRITVDEADVSRYLLESGDVLMTEGGDFDKLGRAAIWRAEVEPCLHQNHVFSVRCDSEKVLPEWVSMISGSRYGRRYFQLCSKQSTNLASINSTQLKALPVPLPEVDEQARVLTLLGKVDSCIVTLRELLGTKKALKGGLAQQLLTGNKRFPEFRDRPWSEVTLGHFFREKVERNAIGEDLPVYSCTKTAGIVPQAERFSKRLASKDLSRYKIVSSGDLVYDPMLLWDGSIGFVPEGERGVVSPAYATFAVRNGANMDYLNLLLKSYRFMYLYKKISRGTNTRRRKAQPTDFLNLGVSIPDVKGERDRMAACLALVQREIDLLSAQCDLYELFKRELTSRLLSGNIRVCA